MERFAAGARKRREPLRLHFSNRHQQRAVAFVRARSREAPTHPGAKMSFLGSGMDARLLLQASMSDSRAWGDLFLDGSSRDGAPAAAATAVPSSAAAAAVSAAAGMSSDQLLDMLDTTSRDGLNLIVKVRIGRGRKEEKAN
jgi:hypothetical protein